MPTTLQYPELGRHQNSQRLRASCIHNDYSIHFSGPCRSAYNKRAARPPLDYHSTYQPHRRHCCRYVTKELTRPNLTMLQFLDKYVHYQDPSLPSFSSLTTLYCIILASSLLISLRSSQLEEERAR